MTATYTILPPEAESLGFSYAEETGESIRHVEVAVSFEMSGNSAEHWEKVFQSFLFAEWATAVTSRHRVRVQKLRVHSYAQTNGVVVDIKMTVEGKCTGEDVLSSYVHLRPLRDCVLVMLRNKESGTDMCVFLKKPNFCSGIVDCLELPDGTFDSEGLFKGPCADLLMAQLNLSICKNEVISLTECAYGSNVMGISTGCEFDPMELPQKKTAKGQPPAASASGECARPQRAELWLYRATLPAGQLSAFEAKIGRLRRHGKAPATSPSNTNASSMQLCIVQLGDAWRSTADACAMSALFLMHELRYHRLMPRYKSSEPESEITQLSHAKFTKVCDLFPTAKGLNLRVKVVAPIELNTPQILRNGKTLNKGTMVVGDDEAIIKLRLVDEQLELPDVVNSSLLIRNGKVQMEEGHMRLVVDRWGKITAAEGDESSAYNFPVNTARDMSSIEYELVVLKDKPEAEASAKSQDVRGMRRGNRTGGRRGGKGRG